MMPTVVKIGEFHKKGLGFVSLNAPFLVERENVISCKSRFFALVDLGKTEPWQLRYFKSKPQENDEAVIGPLEAVISNPALSLKGVFLLNSTSKVAFANGILSISSAERTLLLANEDDDLSQEWFSTIDSYLTSLPAAIVPVVAATRAETPNAQAINGLQPSNHTSVVPRRMSVQVIQENGSSQDMTLESVLADANLRKKFRDFVKSAFAVENLDFYEAVEHHLTLPENNEQELRESVKSIVDTYVRENSSDQVNLSFQQMNAMIEAVENPEMGEVLLCLLQCQHEVVELLRRNFFFRFAALIEADGRRRALLETTNGCFSSLFEKSGVDSFITIMEYFIMMQRDSKLLIQCIKKRYEMFNTFLSAALNPSVIQVKGWSTLQSSSLNTSNVAIKSIFDIYEIHAKVLKEFLWEVETSVLKPLNVMANNVDSTIGVVKGKLQTKFDTIMSLRGLVHRLGNAEIAAKKAIVEMSTQMAELESMGKRKEKELKRLMPQFEKLQKEAQVSEQGRSNAEVELVVDESDATEDFLNALVQLESLALYRLDTIKDLLRKFVFAEHTAINRLGLKFQKTLNDCSNIDSISDLMSLASEVESVALRKRHESVPQASRQAEEAARQAAVIAEADDYVPVAELVPTKRRWI